ETSWRTGGRPLVGGGEAGRIGVLRLGRSPSLRMTEVGCVAPNRIMLARVPRGSGVSENAPFIVSAVSSRVQPAGDQLLRGGVLSAQRTAAGDSESGGAQVHSSSGRRQGSAAGQRLPF